MDSGGGGGGAVVQYTDPNAAYMAGNLGAVASAQASQYATTQINNAINQLNQSYRAASTGLQPYTQTGIEALDKLNQYLGISPYKPAVAPNAPTAPNLGTINWDKGRLEGNQAFSNLSGLAQSLDPTYNPNDAAHSITSLGSKLMQKGQLNAGEMYFLNNFIQQGGSPGMQGGEFLRQFGNPEQQQKAYQAATDQYTLDKANYDQQLAWAEQYGTPMTTADITNNIYNQPGFQAELQAGSDAIAKQAAAKGYLGSGAILKQLANLGQGQLSKYYGDTLSRLAGVAGMGQQSATTNSGLIANQGNNIASLYSNLGDVQANSALTGANSMMQAMIAANQQYKTVGGGGGGGGMGGLGQALGGLGALKSAFAFSAKALKTPTKTPSVQEILNKVNQLNLDQWKYKGIEREHIGPYAEQFQDLFGIGDGRSINLIDCVGVLIGAVKALDQKIIQLQTKGE